MTPQERLWRSRLAKLVSSSALLRGTLVQRDRVCGKPGCRCAKGHKHRGWYLMASKNGKPRQLYVPPELVPIVQEWIQTHTRTRDLMEQVSDLHWDRIRRRKP